METNYDVCIAHLKWSPCLTKNDWTHECSVTNEAEANQVIRSYHAGVLSPDEAVKAMKKAVRPSDPESVFVRIVHAI
jgi:hypothetical protein